MDKTYKMVRAYKDQVIIEDVIQMLTPSIGIDVTLSALGSSQDSRGLRTGVLDALNLQEL